MSDDQEMQSESVMNHRALGALTGDRAVGPSGVAEDLIALLRSPHAISAAVRDVLASALERGLYGNRIDVQNEFGSAMPRIIVEGMGRHGRVNEAIAARQKWFNAAEEVEQRRREGQRGYSVMADVGSRYNLGVDGVKKAIAFRNKYLAEVADPVSEIVRKVASSLAIPPMPRSQLAGAFSCTTCALILRRSARRPCASSLRRCPRHSGGRKRNR